MWPEHRGEPKDTNAYVPTADVGRFPPGAVRQMSDIFLLLQATADVGRFSSPKSHSI